MKIIVCDASPLVFLAKLNRLDLIPEILGDDIFVLRCVVDEVCSDRAGPLETVRLASFFEEARIIDFHSPECPSSALSRSDWSTLKWASENHADWLVADERLLRQVAIEEGIQVVGFLGLLMEGARRDLLSPAEARSAVDDAVSRHGCRISVALYQRVIAVLEELASEF
jgi:predicted nucleic acid-binding protein